MKRVPARPICPQCGSVDVAAGNKTAKCNRCGELFRPEDHTAPTIGRPTRKDWKTPVAHADERPLERAADLEPGEPLDQFLQRRS